ncbi:hypothetical protein AB1L88_21070 [Tautonia sp. JC769]|uniref:hypothetical protein n=1 Tax=Tautonia sp. JC769 TaxID=3232135 RepID=UPI003458B41B
MSRQAILSMPLSFAIVLVAAVALSGTARRADPALPAAVPDDPPPVAEPSPVAPSEPLAPPTAPLVAPTEDPVVPTEVPASAPAPAPVPTTEPTADPFPVKEHPPDEQGTSLPDATARPSPIPKAPQPPPLLDAPEATPDSSRSHGREHWRPIRPRSSPPSP